MKLSHLFCPMLLAFTCAATMQTAHAGQIFTLDAATISGSPGSTIGWGFTASSDDYHMTIANVTVLPGASIGVFNDLLAVRGTFEVGPSPSPFLSTHEAFDNLLGTGVGSFVIDSGAPIGSSYLATMFVVYNLYAVSPNYDPAFDPFNASHTISEGNVFEIPVRVNVVAAAPPAETPEPATWSAVGLAGGLGWAALKRKRRGPCHQPFVD